MGILGSDEKGLKFDSMKLLLSIFLSVTSKMYLSCNDLRCTLHNCDEPKVHTCTKAGFQSYETSKGPVCLKKFTDLVNPQK